jgi:hypothetical protein
MPESTYSVYLIERHGEQGGEREVTSPVRGHSLDFYDTGVWLDRETGRNFFPYEQIRTIREHPEDQAPDRATEPVIESGSEEADRGAEGDRGTEADPETEGDPGAEEDMLE